MAQTDAASSKSTMTGGGIPVLVWIFRVLLIAGAAFMDYSWLQPWWSGDFAVIPGGPDMVLHPWGVDAVSQVASNVDESAFELPYPQIASIILWAYLVVCMLGLLASLFWQGRLRLGRFSVSWALIIILLVGITYAVAPVIAYEIGTLKAAASGAKFVGSSNVLEPATGVRVKMVSQLEMGFWLAIYAGAAVFVLGVIRILFVHPWGKKKAA